jgi:hypothetical protein
MVHVTVYLESVSVNLDIMGSYVNTRARHGHLVMVVMKRVSVIETILSTAIMWMAIVFARWAGKVGHALL